MPKSSIYEAPRLPVSVTIAVRPVIHRTVKHVLMATLILFLMGCGRTSTEEHIALAHKYLDQADYTSATIELKSALQNTDDSAEARWLLGKIYLETSNIPSAEKELLRAQQLGWDANDIRPKLAQAFLLQANFVPIREMPFEDLESTPAANLLSTKALAELAQGNISAARELLNVAKEISPESAHVIVVEAQLTAGLGDLTAALALVDEALKKNPELESAWSLRGDILLEQQDQDSAAALDAYSQAIELSWTGYADRVKRALLYIKAKNYDAAQADANYLLETLPQHPAGQYVQGLIFYSKENFADAIAAFSIAEPASNRVPQIHFYLASAHLMEGNINQASTQATLFLNSSPESIPGRKLLATIRTEQGEFKEAQQLLQPLLDQFPEDIGILNLMANALMYNGDTDLGINLLNKIATLEPNSATAQLRLGSGLMIAGKDKEAAVYLESALRLNPNLEKAEFLLILDLLRKEQFDKALAEARAHAERNAEDPNAHNLLARTLVAAGQQAEGITSYEKALSLDPGNPAAARALATFAVENGDLADARRYLEDSFNQHQESLETLLQLVYLDAKQNDETSMVKHLQEAVRLHPAAITPKILLGRYYLGAGRAEQIAPLFHSLGSSQKRSPEVLQLLALAQLSSGTKYLDAQYTLEQLIKSSPQTASAHYLLAMAVAGSGNKARVRAELENSLALDPDYIPALMAMAKLARREGATTDFQEYVQRLAKLKPQSPEVLKLRAEAAFVMGAKAQAAELSKLVFDAAPSTSAMQDLAAYQFASGNPNGAYETILKWLQQHPNDINARLTLADYLLSNDGLEEAKIQYKAVLQLNPKNVLALNNLAWHTRQEDLNQALEYGRQAAELAPQNALILDTLAVLQHLAEENGLAHLTILRAAAHAPDNPEIRYHRAMIEAAMGDKVSSLALLKELFADGGPDFPERPDALALLKSLETEGNAPSPNNPS